MQNTTQENAKETAFSKFEELLAEYTQLERAKREFDFLKSMHASSHREVDEATQRTPIQKDRRSKQNLN